MRKYLGYCSSIAELVDDEGYVSDDMRYLCPDTVQALYGIVVNDCVTIWIGDDVCITRVIDTNDYESLASDGGNDVIVICAGNAVARRKEQDWSFIV